MQVILHHEGMILGVPTAELQGPGVYEVEDGHVVGYTPLVAPQAERGDEPARLAEEAKPGPEDISTGD